MGRLGELSAMDAAPSPPGTPPAPVRAAIRDLLTSRPEFARLDAPTRRALAEGLVRIGTTAVALDGDHGVASSGTDRPPRPPRLARAQSAGTEYSGVAAQRVAGTTQQILNAVSFPRFVNELITGVFKALLDSNQQQMNSYVELIRNVAASTEGFADANVGAQGARQWLVERFPASFVIEGEADEFDDPGRPLTPEERAERDAETRLRLRPNASMPSEGALRTALGLGPQESVPTGDPEGLVGLARASLARSRQQMLATMVMLGMQRIVIESGRLNASMRFHIDTRSAAAEDRGSSFDLRNEAEAKGSFGFGPWGVEAKVKNTIGYVSTQRTQTTEEMNTDLDLNSSVELVFKTDYLPLDRLAGQGQVDRIRVNTLNPEAEMKAATEERRARREAQAKTEESRRSDLSTRLAPPPPAAPSPARPPAAAAPAPAPAGAPAPAAPSTAPAGAPAPAAPSTAPVASRSSAPPAEPATTPKAPGQGSPAPRR
jgi:hypothetical protein